MFFFVIQVDARAMLTIGPKLCKDKLMQAAGRMRQLEKGQQSIFLVGPESVTEQLPRTNGEITAADVLQWAMQNTIGAVAPEGLTEWAKQGVHFCFTEDNPAHALMDEVLELAKFYCRRFGRTPVRDMVAELVSSWQRRRSGVPFGTTSLSLLIDLIEKRIEEYGTEHEILASGLDEECERELEMEKEEEEEEEVEVPKQDPRAELAWDYGMIFRVSSASTIPEVVSLSTFMEKRFDPDDKLQEIKWSLAGRVYATTNFIQTVTSGNDAGRLSKGGGISQYLRPVDAMVTFHSRYPVTGTSSASILLLSEREADAILELFWKQPSSAASAQVDFVNLSYGRLKHTRLGAFSARKMTHNDVPVAALVGIQLLAGETKFENQEQKDGLRHMLDKPAARLAAVKLPGYRGLQFMLARSDLEIICT